MGIRFLSDFAFFLHEPISSSPTYLPLAQIPVKVSTLITGLEINLFHGPNLYASQGISLDVFLAIFLILPQDTKMPFTFVRSFDHGEGRPGQTYSWVLHKFRCGTRKTSYPVGCLEGTSCLRQDTSRVVARLKTCVVTPQTDSWPGAAQSTSRPAPSLIRPS